LAREGTAEAFTELRQLWHQLVRGELMRRCPCLRHGDLDDVEQEVWITVWQALHSFRGQSAFDTWLVGVAKHVLWGWLRQQRRCAEGWLRFCEFDAADREGLPAADLARHLGLGEAISRLVETERRVIEARYFDDLSDSEIACRLHIPLGTVKGRLRQGLAHLRQALNLGRPEPRARRPQSAP
jgi:RNA polymerase sigma-70 factor (ECF subfamily)